MRTTLLTLKFCKFAKSLQQNEVQKLLTNVESRGHEARLERGDCHDQKASWISNLGLDRKP